FAILAEEMSFPDWWGKNWDACWDCMTDPQLSDLPSQLRFHGLSKLREKFPKDAEALSQLLTDLGKHRTDISVSWD
uniref:barstar family protein n=1 Tax=Lentisalinibacter salinarum TaxID=2992239 RepID=UPI003870CC8E